MKRRYGITYENGKIKEMLAIVTGVMSDGTKVWTECDAQKNLVNMDIQYTMQIRGGWTEFVRL